MKEVKDNMWKNIVWKKNINLNSVLLGIYLFLVWAIYLFVNFYDGMVTMTRFLGLLLLCGIMVYFATKGIMFVASKISLSHGVELSTNKMFVSYCIFTLISTGVLFLWYLANYPGAFSQDSISQYRQAITGNYNDWHPVWHTILFFKVPILITGKAASIILFQIIYFALILGYLCLTIYQFSNLKLAVISLAYILLNPYIACVAMYPWKDVAMSIVILWLMVCVARIYYTNGQWGLKRGRIVLMAILLANATLFRHNAILFTAPMVIALFFQLERKMWLKLIVVFFAFVFFIKFPVYSMLNVEEPDRRKLEIMGLPLTVIANVTKECPEVLDKKTADFVYQMTTQEDWEKTYVCGNFNSIKFTGIDTSVVAETSTIDIIGMTIRCFIVAPRFAFRALFMLTDVVYSIEGDLEGDVFPGIVDNKFDIEYDGNEILQSFLLWYKQVISDTVFKYVQFIGVSILIMLIFVLNKSDLTKWNDWKSILLCIPIFIYDFGTMLLLSGSDSRFFYVSYLVCPVVILIMLRTKEENL